MRAPQRVQRELGTLLSTLRTLHAAKAGQRLLRPLESPGDRRIRELLATKALKAEYVEAALSESFPEGLEHRNEMREISLRPWFNP